jgi:DtxR family transcriptional regulator, Mn-dependent transcriptional regulator
MSPAESHMTRSLEDYLESIYRIQARESVAKVGDIAADLGVSPASVTPAMKRLAEMGLVRYSKRRYVELTPEGEGAARRTLVRHHLLTRFLSEVLGMDPGLAERDACAMEHFLSDEALMGFAALFESTAACPAFPELVQGRFNASGRSPVPPRSGPSTPSGCPLLPAAGEAGPGSPTCLSDQPPGTRCIVSRIEADAVIRGKLIDLGFIQGASVVLMRPAGENLPCIIELDGHDLVVAGELAACVKVLAETLRDEGCR